MDYDNVYMGGYLYAYFEYKKVFIDANVSITYQESEGDDFNTTDIEVKGFILYICMLCLNESEKVCWLCFECHP